MKDSIRHGIDLKVAITLADRANTQPEASVAWFCMGETRACRSEDLCEQRLGPWAATLETETSGFGVHKRQIRFRLADTRNE